MKISITHPWKVATQYVVALAASIWAIVLSYGWFMTYGGRNGCWEWVNKIFHSRGYESCGSLGMYVGLLLGGLIGVLIASRIRKPKNAKKIAIIVASVFIIVPLLIMITLFIVSGFLNQGEDAYLFAGAVVLFALKFLAAASIIPLLGTLTLNRRDIFQKE